MADALSGVLHALDLFLPSLAWIVLAGLLASAAGLVAVGFLLVNLPAGYFCRRTAPDRSLGGRRGIRWWARRVAKNWLGAVIAMLGAVMALPFVPGPGLLVALVGITLTDLPGKRRLESWVVRLPGVLPAINTLRSRFGKPPVFLHREKQPARNTPDPRAYRPLPARGFPDGGNGDTGY